MKVFAIMTIPALAVGALGVSCAENARRDVDREQLKEELKREILAELEVERSSGGGDPVAEVSPAAPPPGVPSGTVTGRVLLGERGLPGCKVRLVHLGGGVGPLALFSTYREGFVLEAETVGDGVYSFEAVPVGAYRLKWFPPGEIGWIRRVSDRPDVVVRAGETSTASDFHAGRPLLDG